MFRALIVVMVGVVVGCSPASSGAESASPSHVEGGGHGAAIGPTPSPTPSTSPTLSIAMRLAVYGELMIETTPGALCRARAQLPSGGTVLAAAFLSDQQADSIGRAEWVYSVPVAGAGEGSGEYVVHCALGSSTADATAEFVVP